MRKRKKLRGEAAWIDLEARVYHGKKNRYKAKSGWLANAIASSVRRSVKESFKPTKQSTYSKSSKESRLQTAHKYGSRKESKSHYVPMTVDEMPEELRYLSYPHLKPKANVPTKRVKATPEMCPPAALREWRLVDDIRELFNIVRLFFIDIRKGNKHEKDED